MNIQKELLPITDINYILEILDKVSLFGGLNETQYHTVFKYFQKINYCSDEIIYREGDSPSYIYIIKSGTVKLIHERNNFTFAMAEYKVGNCFGETSLIGIQPQNSTAKATEDTTLYVLSKESLRKLFKLEKDIFGIFMMNIARESCRRLLSHDSVMLDYLLNQKL